VSINIHALRTESCILSKQTLNEKNGNIIHISRKNIPFELQFSLLVADFDGFKYLFKPNISEKN
jgi:hypothetical protein